MRASHQIFKVRRQYNQWVADESLEDYALRFTATKARRWSISRVGNTALGATAFLALEALAATITLHYGFLHAFWAIIAFSVTVFLVGLPICFHAAKHGLDVDLLTRSAGFGYLGSTVTSLIYAAFTFIFFAIEAAIMASAFQAMFNIPMPIGYLLCAVLVIPVVSHGITTISRFQLGSQGFWLVLQIVALLAVFGAEFSKISDWTHYEVHSEPASQGFNLAIFGAAAALLFALIAQIGEQVDYLRFMPEKTTKNQRKWWLWLILAGPGWIFIGLIKMLFGSFLAFIAISDGASLEQAIDPVYMYQIAYSYFSASPQFALYLAGVMVIISQMKINVTNAYAGSIAWSNFFSRLTHNHPGRVVWLVFNVAIALILMELGIYRVLESILGIFALVAIGWLGSVCADLTVNNYFNLRPKITEFKRSHLYDINPVGFGSMLIATGLGTAAYLGNMGEALQALAHFFTLGLCFILSPAIAYLTGGKFYIAREAIPTVELPAADSPKNVHSDESIQCSICENTFEAQDMSYCPAYQGNICSLCCSLDSRCLDACKPHARLGSQIATSLSYIVPKQFLNIVSSRLGRFFAIFISVNTLILFVLSLIYLHVDPTTATEADVVKQAMIAMFFMLMIVFGVISWLFLLAHESREVAQQESNRQSQLLLDEIDAHSITDASLQEAKELAERANEAKSRYLSGISHELRTPLQSMLGYTQLLLNDIHEQHRDYKALNIVKRNGDYLADLIEGLLDISKIEAGRLDIYRNHFALSELLDQVVEMFRPQALAKGLHFEYEKSYLPATVVADQKRLRQILINLLSNAIKYTKAGSVVFSVKYQHQVAIFTVTDTGVGIHQADVERVLHPFERVQNKELSQIQGTGLGLTIVRLLTEIMGGELTVESEIGKGSSFKVSLMLSSVAQPIDSPTQAQPVTGYMGPRKWVFVVDDEAIHRGILSELLQPIGFQITEAPDASSALALLEEQSNSPDLFLLDVSMPDIDGLTLAKVLRQRGYRAPIIMISAEAKEHHDYHLGQDAHDAYIVKPLSLTSLLKTIGEFLSIQWVYKTAANEDKSVLHADTAVEIYEPKVKKLSPLLRQLVSYAESGYAKGVNETLNQIENKQLLSEEQRLQLRACAEHYQFETIIKTVKYGDQYDHD